jgi:hypothetical protein
VGAIVSGIARDVRPFAGPRRTDYAHRMKSRAWMLLAAALVAPAWSQEPAAMSPGVTLHSIDLSSAIIKQIIRDTAATQYSTARLVEQPRARQKPAARESISIASTDPPAHRTPPQRPAAAALPRDGILSGLIDALIDDDEDHPELAPNPAFESCLWNYRDQTSTQRNQTCRK